MGTAADGGHEHDGLYHHGCLPRVLFGHADSEAAMRELYTALMTADHAVVEANMNSFVHKLRVSSSEGGGGSV